MIARHLIYIFILSLLCRVSQADVLGDIKSYPEFSVQVGIFDPSNPTCRPVVELGWSRATGALAFYTAIYQEMAPDEGGNSKPIRGVAAKVNVNAIFGACKEFTSGYSFPKQIPLGDTKTVGSARQSFVSFSNGKTGVSLTITDDALPAAREIQRLIVEHFSGDQKKWLDWTLK